MKKNHDRFSEVWLVYFKAYTNRGRISYDDAVEEAICFGWIDGKVRRIDEEKHMQRFTPRITDTWSERNVLRAKEMIRQGLMTPVGLAKFKLMRRELVLPEKPKTPFDLKKALSRNKKAVKNWMKFPPSSKKHWIWWIISAKQLETRKRRILRVVENAVLNKKL